MTEVDRSLLSTRSKQIITSVLPKKPTDTPPINQPGKIGPKLSIFEKYDLIKKKNQTLTSSTYKGPVLEADFDCTTQAAIS
jgi:hypothetical protein